VRLSLLLALRASRKDDGVRRRDASAIQKRNLLVRVG